MLAIKFRRIGKKHQPSYRLVVMEKRSKVRGKYVEDLGWYNPRSKAKEVKKERVEHWLKVGAKATDTVHNFLVSAGVIAGPKIAVHKKSKKAEVTPSKTEAPVEKAVQEKAVEEKPVA